MIDRPGAPTALPLVVERPRTAAEIAARLERLLGAGAGAVDRPLQTALLRIAARHAEILTAQLNAAPALHLAAFDRFLAGRPRPAAAARTVLVFRPAPGRAAVVVPMHTQVAAPPQGDDAQPVVFETCDDLELVRATLVRAWLVDAGHRRQADLAALVSPSGRDAGLDPLAAATPVPQTLHFGFDGVPDIAGLRELRLRWQAEADRGGPLEVGIATPTGFQPLVARGGATADGGDDRIFDAPAAWPVATLAGSASRWLTVRPASASTPAPAPAAAAASAPAADATRAPPVAPSLRSITLQLVAAAAPAAPAAACANQLPLDISKDFFPLGERPRFGDVFQLRSPAFATPGAHVDVQVQMTNPAGDAASPIPPVSRAARPLVAWELSTADGFRALSVGDGTRSLTADGALTFTVPPDVAATTIAGQTGAWMRARLVSGDFGSTPSTDATPAARPCAPAIRSVTVASTLALGPLSPEHVVRDGALARTALPTTADALELAGRADVDGAALYLGFAADGSATERPFTAGRTLTVHLRAAPPRGPGAARGALPRWQQRTLDGWRELAVVDDATAGLTRSGVVRLRLVADAAPWPGCQLDPTAALAWLRLVWPAGDGAPPTLPVGIALNAVAAVQSQQLRDEPLGSGLGRASQAFKALRTPIVGAVRLQVREDDGDDWRDAVDWHEVADFAASQPDARHFTLDRQTGRVVFGDGRRGRILPAGANNVRLQAYAVGGGRRGNCPPGSIALLRTALPGVDGAVNLDAATGGLDAEDDDERQAHASAWLRHRDRAVGADDFAELAARASPEVARAWCVAGRDLAAAPPAPGAEAEPGVVSVVVLPRGEAPRPQPGPALLDAVAAHLDARRAPVGRLVVVGPVYAPWSVSLRFVPTADRSAQRVAAEVTERIARFLHPLGGGPDGRGWAPGQRPHRSDIVALAGAVPGVDVVGAVRLHAEPGAPPTALVAAGRIDVAVGT